MSMHLNCEVVETDNPELIKIRLLQWHITRGEGRLAQELRKSIRREQFRNWFGVVVASAAALLLWYFETR